MTFSNLLKSSIVVASLLLGACSTESNKTKEVGFNEPNRFPGEGNFRVDSLVAKSTINAEYNDYSILTKKTFNLEACIKDPLYAPVQAAIQFAVVDGTGSERVLSTDSRGCLNWAETHSFTFVGRETYFKIKRRIESRSMYTGYVDVEVALNPWADGGASVIDLRYTEDIPANAPVVELNSVSLRGQKLNTADMNEIGVNLKGASFQFVGLDRQNIEITQNLGIKLAHKYIFKISPMIVRKTISKPVVLEVISTGKMKVTFLILREDENPSTQFNIKNVVSSTQFEGEFVAGELTGTTSIKFENIAELTSRTLAVLTLTPVTQLDGFPKVSFTGPIAPGRVGTLNLVPTKFDATDIHNQYIKKLNEFKAAELKPEQLFEKHSGFKRMTNMQPELQNWMNSYLAGHTGVTPTDDWRLFGMLCDQLFNEPGMDRYKNKCRSWPQQYLVYGKRSLVDSILTPNPKMAEVTTVDNFRMSWSQGLSRADAQSVGMNFKAGASLGLNLGYGGTNKFLTKLPTPTTPPSPNGTTWGGNFAGNSGLSLSVGGDYSISRVWRKDSSVGVSSSREQAVTAEGRRYEFVAMVRKCFSVSLTEEKIAELNAKGIEGNFRQFVCSNTVSKEKRFETYYLVNSKTGVDNSPASDNDSNSSSQWRMMVRGSRMMNLFLEISNSGLFEFSFAPVKGLDAESEYLNRFKELYPVVKQSMTEEFPGFLSDE